MEYCSGGSLLSLLEEPENAFGLPEPEFLTVLQCVGGLPSRFISPCNWIPPSSTNSCHAAFSAGDEPPTWERSGSQRHQAGQHHASGGRGRQVCLQTDRLWSSKRAGGWWEVYVHLRDWGISGELWNGTEWIKKNQAKQCQYTAFEDWGAVWWPNGKIYPILNNHKI